MYVDAYQTVIKTASQTVKINIIVARKKAILIVVNT